MGATFETAPHPTDDQGSSPKPRLWWLAAFQLCVVALVVAIARLTRSRIAPPLIDDQLRDLAGSQLPIPATELAWGERYWFDRGGRDGRRAPAHAADRLDVRRDSGAPQGRPVPRHHHLPAAARRRSDHGHRTRQPGRGLQPRGHRRPGAIPERAGRRPGRDVRHSGDRRGPRRGRRRPRGCRRALGALQPGGGDPLEVEHRAARDRGHRPWRAVHSRGAVPVPGDHLVRATGATSRSGRRVVRAGGGEAAPGERGAPNLSSTTPSGARGSCASTPRTTFRPAERWRRSSTLTPRPGRSSPTTGAPMGCRR